MQDFIQYLKECVQSSIPFVQLEQRIREQRLITAKGLLGSLKSIVLSLLFDKKDATVFFITYKETVAEQIKEDLAVLAGDSSIVFFPSTDFSSRKKIYSNNLSQSYRMDAIEKLTENKKLIVVTYAQAISRLLPDVTSIKRQRLSLKKASTQNFEEIIEHLIAMGYQRQPIIDQMGEMSVRGGIIDVFPYSKDYPIRIEFWGNMIESIREFDIETQRSLQEIKDVSIYPIEQSDQIENSNQSVSAQKYSYSLENSLLSLIGNDALIVLDEPALIADEVEDYRAEMEKYYHLGQPVFDLIHDRKAPFFSWTELAAMMNQFQQLNFVCMKPKGISPVVFSVKGQPTLQGNLSLLKNEVMNIYSEKKVLSHEPVFFLCDYADQAERMKELFEELELPPEQIQVRICGLHEGFDFEDVGLVVYTDHQFYGRQRRIRLHKKFSKGLNRSQLKMLRRGDFVVHNDFGIGIFLGLKKIQIGGHERECIEIEYQNKDVVYVPLDRMMSVQKYSAKEGVVPTISKLGGTDWDRLKKRTKKKIKNIAKDLIAIYAARKASPGFAFSKDTLWQKELEASFPYEDTPDQVQATQAIKADMETDRPMDRLICGDVGFGKTELAIRAAFKAVNDSKQVAVLAPTTVLAQQHFRTFKQRLANYPIQVEVLSRFKSKSEQIKIIQNVNNGAIDIIIGTHKILSNNLKFNNLGLLIIDEEQRFGVRQKERLKQHHTAVDTLTLTATPIPRTLHMSLMGARDMSNINTPPKDRLPIITEVIEFDEDIIRDAIIREMQRGGQVFYVYNRVKSIETAANMLRRIVPEARIAVAHGQMYEAGLQRVMLRFLDKQFDVLVCTTIIENGLDIPNVNTIIIHRADRFGLADLYQLRGRVGRTNQHAFAYLVVPHISRINNTALKRVQTIEEFTDLGSGFQIAMRDLEIRGAGNLLGAEQSGFIAALGFHLYCKILDEAVKELTGDAAAEQKETLIDPMDVQVDVDTDVFIPDNYINRGDLRLDFYRRLVDAQDLFEIEKIAEELRDRFGKLPSPVKNLLNVLSLKFISSKLGISKLSLDDVRFQAEFVPEIYELKGREFKRWVGSLVEKSTAPFEFVPQDILKIRLNLTSRTNGNELEFIKNFLQSLL